ncbi:hypothetical protein DCC79_13060 [bacterium]|nr:hypothetical protein [Chloroflexi bacterium CFX6]RIL08726.1 MAG: hypothetical protein DCC79_13060 [bacterium]
MVFRPAPSRGGWIGVALVVAAVAVEAMLAAAAWSDGPGPRAAMLGILAAVLLPASVFVAYWAWGFFSLRYTLTRDGLTIAWAASRQIVPMEAITHILAGRPYAAPLRGFRWPGHEVGRTIIRDDNDHPQTTLVYATTEPAGQIVIVTPSLAYAISPADPVAFIDDFKMRRRLGPVQVLQQHTEQARWARSTLWRDPTGLALLAAGFLLNVLAWAWLTWKYPGLPAEVNVQFRYDPVLRSSVPEVLQPLATVWRLPQIGLAGLVANGALAALVHGRARMAALLLLLGAVLVQVGLTVVLSRLGAG